MPIDWTKKVPRRRDGEGFGAWAKRVGCRSSKDKLRLANLEKKILGSESPSSDVFSVIRNALEGSYGPVEVTEDIQEPKDERGFVYIIQGETTGLIKVGYASDPSSRIKQIQAHSPDIIKILCVFRGFMSDESRIHKRFKKYRRHGEWFEPSQELMDFVKEMIS